MSMFGLKLPTDPRWVNIAEKEIEEILIDHAFCEQKAASAAISFIVQYPERSELVTAMLELAREELEHFQLVHKIILDRGIELDRTRKDEYVKQLHGFFPKGGSRDDRLVQELLIAGLIEARSCERFRLLSEQLSDKELANFFGSLMASEAGHYALFLKFARQYGGREKADKKWNDLLEFEAKVIAGLGNKGLVHG